MGIGRPYFDPAQLFQFSGYPLAFSKQGIQIQLIGRLMTEQIGSGFDGEGIHRPGHPVAPQFLKQVFMSGEISQAETGNGKALGHGMKQQDIG